MLSAEWLAAFAPIGAVQEPDRWTAFGACVFFSKDPFVWTITAGHVIDKIASRPVSILLTRSQGGLSLLPIGSALATHGIDWIRDRANDLAAAPTPITPELEIKSIPVEYCLRFEELLPSMPCFTIGCPYGLHGVDQQRATPLVLDGVIAGVDRETKRVYTSAPTFPGNSGGPLIAVRIPFAPEGSIVVGRPTILLAGIMLETRLVFAPEPNIEKIPPLHLGFAVSTNAIIDMVNSEAAQAIVTKLSLNMTK